MPVRMVMRCAWPRDDGVDVARVARRCCRCCCNDAVPCCDTRDGMVVGTILGAAIAANSADDVRWEACDDARELSRHIAGAAMMGFGGVLALGCTIGQGVSAASLLAVSVPVSMLSIIFGARLGLAWLLEGSIVSAFRR